ncbi:caspase domain protein [mine drainage metagenome]|uniref:Caspase domain protein n=1 Tax=mine drainage metagenome TaxID=410659 RepID=A0A1J5TEA8_9ZZZZ
MRVFSYILLVLACMALPAHARDERNLTVKQVNTAVSEKRIALVIGNGAYTNSPLKNPVNDAKDVASRLRRLGFEVVERHNLTTKLIGRTLSEFRSKLEPGSVALVFYAGHGIQIKGENYLPAVDADIASEEDAPNQSLAVKQIMDVLDEAKTRLNLVFLDACRNNPYARSFRSAAGEGLARISAPSGTLISFATRPGSVAEDGIGRNGLYTSKLLLQMNSNQPIELALKQVVTAVKTASQGRQEPWMEGSIEGDFCFRQCGGAFPVAGSASAAPSGEAVELAYWDSIKDSNNFRDFDSYLEKYPNGSFADIAKMRGGYWLHDSKGCSILVNNAARANGPPDSLTWSGECLNGKVNGHGVVEVSWGKNKGISELTYINGIPSGSISSKSYRDGILVVTTETTITQMLDNGDIVSSGKRKASSSNDTYEGQFLNGRIYGQGKLTTKDGFVVEGELHDGKCTGKAKVTMPNGAVYVGDVSPGCDGNGYGILTESNGKRYEGRWVEGKFMGQKPAN